MSNSGVRPGDIGYLLEQVGADMRPDEIEQITNPHKYKLNILRSYAVKNGAKKNDAEALICKYSHATRTAVALELKNKGFLKEVRGIGTEALCLVLL